MRQWVVYLIVAFGAVVAHATYVVHTIDGHVYKNCTVIVAANSAVIVRCDKGEVTIPLDRITSGDRTRLEPEMKRLRQEAEKVAVRNAELSAARKAAAESSQYTDLNPPLDIATGDGRIYHGVSRMIIDGTGEIVTLNSSAGIERIKFDSLSSDWQTKLQPALEKAKEDGTEYLWQKRIKDAKTEMERNRAKHVTATLCGSHPAGVRAYLTSESKDLKVVKVTTEVIISGLPENQKFGNWSGTLLCKDVFANRNTGEVFQVWSAH